MIEYSIDLTATRSLPHREGLPPPPAGTLDDSGLVTTTRGLESIANHEQTAARIGLSPRELEIVRQVAHDRSNKEIAAVLGISVWTVSTHLRRIFAKLDVHTRAAMVARVVAPIGGTGM